MNPLGGGECLAKRPTEDHQSPGQGAEGGYPGLPLAHQPDPAAVIPLPATLLPMITNIMHRRLGAFPPSIHSTPSAPQMPEPGDAGCWTLGARHRRTREVPVDARDVLTRPAPPPDVIRYGPGENQIADLRLPASRRVGQQASRRGIPLALFFHGGFWRAAYDRRHTEPPTTALAAEGFAVCAPEYRRTGQPDGGTGCHRRPAGIGPHQDALVWWALAAISDLVACYQQGLGNGAVAKLLGAGPDGRPDRYAITDPTALIPAGFRCGCCTAATMT